jgi:hypothetical protein
LKGTWARIGIAEGEGERRNDSETTSESPWEIGSRGLEPGTSWHSRGTLTFISCEDPRRVSISAKSEKAGNSLAGKETVVEIRHSASRIAILPHSVE